ncbi:MULTISPECIES: LacI family DNA-binding transcriptional regulator [Streptomyces]|uniref:LacI family transcriptional regulator n=1 Tax=Streptomyces cadmiisoli TaxID=2184053 RepID=A0A2Z4J8R7_9ACTN|nr:MULTISPECIES: LacI family DNA-binding transcriptional regulator [Streptomyces]AWW41521.1 LacI family transcriptional regulator [Streptomyces cadmiisoli]KOV74946.1 LacI family transcriptional regulator [Streptomyces sp. AS58]
MGAQQRPTIKTVAARAGVGRTTVSRVINGSTLVSDEAKAAVLAAIAELNYVPNSVARGLVTRRTNSVALVIPEAESRLGSEPYFAGVIRGVSTVLGATRTQLQLMLVRDRGERDQLTDSVAERRVDGVLLVSVHEHDPLPGILENLGLPTVLAGRRSPTESLSHAVSDNLGGGREAGRHLISRGRTSIATIAGPLDMDVSRGRLRGWKTALEEAGMTPDERLIASADFTEDGGMLAMRSLLERAPHLDAVFAASDVMAAGAMLELRRQGRRVPEDVAVVGFDDSPVARYAFPSMTSVSQPVEEIGSTIARILLDEIADPTTPRRQVVLPTELVVRDSS